jgi:predicted RNase H-like nuclease
MKNKYILGVDAAWTNKEPSGVSLIRYSDDSLPELIRVGRSYEEFCNGKIQWSNSPNGSLPNFREILNSFEEQVDIIALDIPLSPEPITGRRTSDNMISAKYGKFGASTHTPNIDRPGEVAITIYQQLTELGFEWAYEFSEEPSFIEVYPHTAIIELFSFKYRFPYKISKKGKYWPEASPQMRNRNIISNLQELKGRLQFEVKNVESFLVDLDQEKQYSTRFLKGYEDLLDSIISALVGYYYATQSAVAYGNDKGTIWVPMKA